MGSCASEGRPTPDVSDEANAVLELFQSVFTKLSEYDAKTDVTRVNLTRWFGDSMNTTPIQMNDLARASALDLVRLFDYPGDFVPVVAGEDGEAVRQVNVI